MQPSICLMYIYFIIINFVCTCNEVCVKGQETFFLQYVEDRHEHWESKSKHVIFFKDDTITMDLPIRVDDWRIIPLTPPQVVKICSCANFNTVQSFSFYRLPRQRLINTNLASLFHLVQCGFSGLVVNNSIHSFTKWCSKEPSLPQITSTSGFIPIDQVRDV